MAVKSVVISALFLFLAGMCGPAAAGEPVASTGPGTGVTGPGRDAPCDGSLVLTYDGTAENGYAWQYGGVELPDWGAFAEGCTGTGYVCGVQFHLTTLPGYFNDQSLDAYVYSAAGDVPGDVLSVTPGIHVDPPAIWPAVSIHEIAVASAAVEGAFFVGWWGNWPGQLAGWFVAASTNGPQGLPRVKVAPGVGYPTGWQDVSLIWGPTRSLGIGGYLAAEPPPTPVSTGSWGRVKSLF